MRFIGRELMGWLLVVLGLLMLFECYQLIVNEAKLFQGVPLSVAILPNNIKDAVRSGNGADPERGDQCRRGRAAVEGDDEQQRVRTADRDRGDPDAADRDRSCHSVRAPGCTDLR